MPQHASMKVLSLLLRNVEETARVRGQREASMKVLSLLLRNQHHPPDHRPVEDHASMKVLSLLLRNRVIVPDSVQTLEPQ